MKKFLLLIAVFVFSGCATQSKTIVIYSNPNVFNEDKNTQWLIDRGECLQESHKIPWPTSAPCLQNSSYARGYCQGRQIRQLAEAEGVRQQIFDGCIAKKGYQKEVKVISK